MPNLRFVSAFPLAQFAEEVASPVVVGVTVAAFPFPPPVVLCVAVTMDAARLAVPVPVVVAGGWM